MAKKSIKTSAENKPSKKPKLTFEQETMMRSSVRKRKGRITVNTSLDGESVTAKAVEESEDKPVTKSFILVKRKSKKYRCSTEKDRKKVKEIKSRIYKDRKPRKKLKLAKKLKYTTVKSDYGDEKAIISVDEAVRTVKAAGGISKTVISSPATLYKGVKTGAGKIQTGYARAKKAGKELATAVRSGKALRYTGRIAGNMTKGAVVGSVKTAVNIGKKGVSAAGDNILHQQVNKSITTDTGIESLKQGATYARYADNARKAGVNTIRTIKNTPQNVKKAIEKTKKAAKVVGGLLKSKAVIVAVLAAVIINLISSVISGGFAVLVSAPASTFSWLSDDDETKEKKILKKYIKIIDDEVKERQEEIDDIYYNFECDKTEYSGEEITEFRTQRFNYNTININDDTKYSEIIAMAATKWYSEYILNGTELPEDLKLKKSTLKEIVGKYYTFTHDVEYDYCPHYGCCNFGIMMTGGEIHGDEGRYVEYDYCFYCDNDYHGCKEITEWINCEYGEWNYDTIYSGSRTYCNNPNHAYLTGGVINRSTYHVLNEMDFNDDEKAIYEVYKEKIYEWLTEED